MSTLTLNTRRLTECREKLSITKQEAARRMGMPQPTYLRYENGDRSPSLPVLKTISEALNTSVDYLTSKTNNPSPDVIVIKKGTDHDLFLLIEKIKSSDADYQKHILEYAKTL